MAKALVAYLWVFVAICAAEDRALAPAFELQAYEGDMRRLSEFRGRVVVVNFWATWCKPCREEIPRLGRMRAEYRSRGVEVVGVAMDERGWRVVTPFVLERGMKYPVLLGTPRVARDYGGLETLPYTVFVDRRGRIAATVDRVLEEATLRRVVELLLAER